MTTDTNQSTHDPVLTLLTDFGHADAYVGAMKGVILTNCRRARIVDLAHDLAPGDIAAASHLLGSAWKFFPEGTVHVAVVDPTVGSDRAVVAGLADGQYFVGPDNGLFSAVMDRAKEARWWRVTRREFYLSPMSRTFHGRDVFAPLGAALARGIAIDDLGEALTDPVRLGLPEAHADDNGALHGVVVHADRFGNLITNLPGRLMPIEPVVRAGSTILEGLVKHYAQVEPGEALAIIGSGQTLELCVRDGSAAATLGLGVGDPVVVEGAARWA